MCIKSSDKGIITFQAAQQDAYQSDYLRQRKHYDPNFGRELKKIKPDFKNYK